MEVCILIDKKLNIFNCGKDLFCSKGFKDTNVSDITRMARIGTGTFYNYYPSKEQLFLEIYLKESEELRKSIIASVNLNDEPVKLSKDVCSQFFIGMNSNPILKGWYDRDIFRILQQYYNEENGKDFYHDFFAELIKKWQNEGMIKSDIDYELILAMFSSLAYIDAHKKDIGINFFPGILDYLAEFITKGLLVAKIE